MVYVDPDLKLREPDFEGHVRMGLLGDVVLKSQVRELEQPGSVRGAEISEDPFAKKLMQDPYCRKLMEAELHELEAMEREESESS